jgi:hypothetical protein
LVANDLVITGWSGLEFAQIAACTLPVIHAYAARHGAGCACANLASSTSPASWMKVPAIIQGLRQHERVAWIDADVVILDDSLNIFDELGDSWQALVEHETPCGMVPNCGVWVLGQQMIPTLTEIWDAGRFIDHAWWEQAAILDRMGYRVEGVHSTLEAPTDLYRNTKFLDPTWNHHPADARKVLSPHFLHVTQYANRLETIKKLCAEWKP